VRVYKYMCSKFAKKTIRERRFKISEFADMNDPFELAGVVLPDETLCKVLVDLANETGALCFSRKRDNPLLWSHYADKHRGLCLVFDIELGPKVEVLKIDYVKIKPKLSVEPFLRAVAARREGRSLTPEERSEAKKVVMPLYCTKFEKWRYENEVRFLVSREVNEEGLWFHPFDDEFKLREVIAGARCCETRVVLEDTVKCYTEPVRIVKVRLSDMAFKVEEDPNGFI
jgi:hypothetical protein